MQRDNRHALIQGTGTVPIVSAHVLPYSVMSKTAVKKTDSRPWGGRGGVKPKLSYVPGYNPYQIQVPLPTFFYLKLFLSFFHLSNIVETGMVVARSQ